MVRPIVQDVFFLAKKSEAATQEDAPVVQDLLDTLQANQDRCIGIAANMISVRKRMMVVSTGLFPLVLINPIIVKKSGPFEAVESCLSLPGARKALRYKVIEVNYLDKNFNAKQKTFEGLTAQVIQHEMDHFEGRLI
ncbi:MAG: peptide deformylase [Blautia sp.]|nr:peptide deformylase [Blautia sp.]